MKSSLLALVKLLRITPHLVVGLYISYGPLPRLSHEHRSRRIEAWVSALLDKFAIKLIVNGTPPLAGPMLLVSNHISWLDILVMHAARHCRFVSKADVKNWPVIGTLANVSGTLFIERGNRRDAMRMVQEMGTALTNGHILAVFPEGTTGNGIDLLPFHANLLQAAVLAEAPVQPVALKFVDERTGNISHGPSFVGNETFIASFWRTLKTPDLVAIIHYGSPQTANGRDRRNWADDLRDEVQRLRQL